MADRSSALVITALTRAAADAGGMPLHATRNLPGLFPTSALGKQAAQRCRDEGYLESLPVEQAPGNANGRSAPTAMCTITDKGLAYLLGQVSPRQVLEDFVRVLEEREAQVADLLRVTRTMQASLESLRGAAANVLTRLAGHADLKSLFHEFRNESPPAAPTAGRPDASIVAALSRWSPAASQEDCSLPDLHRQVAAECPGLSIGSFHDALRRLVANGQIHLHPWTGPLYEIPDPPFALLFGHVIAYYANLRTTDSRCPSAE